MRRGFNWRLAFLAIGAALLIWIIVGIVLAGREPAPPPSGGQPLTFNGCKTIGNRLSTRSWTFDCTRATLSPDGVSATVEGVHNGILYKNGKPYVKIAAKQVSVNTQTLDFTATGTVHIETIASGDQPARSFETDLVQWNNATKMLQLTHPSIIRTGDQILKVATITVDVNKSEVHLGKIEGALEAPQP